MARPHERLGPWRYVMRLVKAVRLITRRLPREEMCSLAAQMRRAAVSVPSNLAEGAARSTTKELAQFMSISMASPRELETQALIALELSYLPPRHEIFSHLERVAQLLYDLRRNVPG